MHSLVSARVFVSLWGGGAVLRQLYCVFLIRMCMCVSTANVVFFLFRFVCIRLPQSCIELPQTLTQVRFYCCVCLL